MNYRIMDHVGDKVHEDLITLEKREEGVYVSVNDWYVLRLSNEGTVILSPGLSGDLGFKLDPSGYIKVEKAKGPGPG